MKTPHPGRIIYITGAPASGKTTIARALVAALRARGVVTMALDSDELRRVLTPEPRYSPDERDWFYGVLGELALLAFQSGVTVVISATSSRRAYRDHVRMKAEAERRGPAAFFEVHLVCPLAVRRQRDPKGLYRRQAQGEVQNLPGADAAYEPPLAPELEFDTSSISADAAVQAIVARMEL